MLYEVFNWISNVLFTKTSETTNNTKFRSKNFSAAGIFNAIMELNLSSEALSKKYFKLYKIHILILIFMGNVPHIPSTRVLY